MTETKPHIPPYLKTFGWYASHQAWLKSKGWCYRHDPGDAPAIRANLRGSDLRGSDLSGSDLSDSDLSDSDLSGSDLRGSNLRGSNLRGSDLSGSDLSDSDLRGSNLRGSNLRGSNLRGSVIPIVQNIDAAMLAAIEANKASGKNGLKMDNWHGADKCDETNWCETTHCRAGYAICLAGKAGFDLEKKFGPNVAGALIYAASGSHPVPNFYDTNEGAMADIRRRAGVEPAEGASHAH